MKWLIWAISLFVLLVLQLAFSELNFPSTPNLILIYLCVLLLYLRTTDILWLAVIGGVMLDLFSGIVDGVMILALLGGVWGAYYIGQAFFTEKLSNLILLFYTIFASIFFFLIVITSQFISLAFDLTAAVDVGYLFMGKLGSDVIMNLLFLFPIYYFYELQSKVENRFRIHNESI